MGLNSYVVSRGPGYLCCVIIECYKTAKLQPLKVAE